MASYVIPPVPVYDPEVRRLENLDPANASTIFNPILGKMVINTAAVKVVADSAFSMASTGADDIADLESRLDTADGDITGLDGRLGLVETALHNRIVTNIFMITFDSLNGLTVANGIWNKSARRLEV